MSTSTLHQIIEALINVGFKNVEETNIRTSSYGNQHSVVFNGEYVGVWDEIKKRFKCIASLLKANIMQQCK